MYTEQDIELLKTQLVECYGNYIEILVSETGISRPTVSKFLNNKPIKAKNKTLIYRTGCQLIAKKREEDKSLIKNLKQMANGDSSQGKQVRMKL